MVFITFGNGLYSCKSTDTKPTTGIPTDSVCLEVNTGVQYHFTAGAWSTIASGGGSGETNTYSTSGTGAAWTQTKSAANLPFRSFIVGSTKLSLTVNTNDLTLDVNQANLSIAYSQLTAVPTSFAPSAHSTTHASAGTDAIQIDVIGAGTDITTNNTTTLKHGLAPKLSNIATEFLNGQGVFATPSGTGGGEANTYSSVGTGSVLTLTKSGVNLPFRSILAASTKIAVATTTNEVTLDVNQANLSIAYSQITSVPTTIVKTDQVNVFGAFNQTIPSSRLLINNPAGTFAYTIVAAAIAAGRTLTLPLLTGNDTMVTEAFSQTLTNKTISGAANTLTNVPWASLTSVPTSFAPSAHATTHYNAGTDPLHIDTIGAGTDITTNNVSTIKHGLMSKLPGGTTTYYRSDGTWATPSGAGGGETNTYSNAGVGGIGVTLTKSGVDLPFKSVKANSIKIGITDGGANNNVLVDVNDANLSIGWGQLTSIPSTIVKTDQINVFGAFDQQFNGSTLKIKGTSTGVITIATGLTGTTSYTVNLPSATTTLTGIGNTATLTNKTISGADNTLSNISWASLINIPTSFAPSAHATSHNSAGSDVVHIDTIGDGTDITTNNVSITKHGLVKKLSNVATEYYNGTGNWSVPAGGGGGSGEINTYSNAGTGTSIILTKSGVDLPFKAILAASTKIAIANDTVNSNVTVDVNQANLSIAYSQLTAVPTSFAPSAHKATHIAGGTDAFAKGDKLSASVRYLDEQGTEPTTDSARFYIPSTSQEVKYWDTLATSVKRTIVNTDSTQTLANKTLTSPVIGTIVNTGTITLPTVTTTLAGIDQTATLTNKTVSLASNTVTDTVIAAGSLLVSNGTKYVGFAKGTVALQVLRTKSDLSGVEWASLNSETTGKATASGTGTQTVYTIAHGIGAIPSSVFVNCSSLINTFTYTVDTTNITITFTTAPASGTNNITFYWRAVA